MFVLGVNTGPHDGSAALLYDGNLVTMVEQERLSRRKRAFGESPAEAIRACLDGAGVTLDQVAEISVGWDVPRLASIEGTEFDSGKFCEWLFPREIVQFSRMPPVTFIPHHVAHAASALWTSGADRAAILVLDGRGEKQATTIALGTPEGIKILRQWDTMRSIGHFYGFAAEWAGLSVWDAGKLMGLAAYGDPSQRTPLACLPDGYDITGHPKPHDRVPYHYYQLRTHLRRSFSSENFPYSDGAAAEQMAHADFAASVQRALEEVVFRLAEIARDLTGAQQLVLAGGVALNCTMNGRLADSGIFDDYYVPPVPHDAGVSVGAALLAHRRHGHSARDSHSGHGRLTHAFWGPEHSEDEVIAALRAAGLRAARMAERDLVSRVADHLAAGHLVGWWQGRSEIGQRALGARSILGDPRYRRNLVRLNTLKGREAWRPLAPSVLSEFVPDLFGGKLPSMADFMLSACAVRPEARRIIPAAVHVDGSARPQVVRKDVSPRYWSLINAFRERTGVPAVINTSFNLAGEPNVFSAADAISAFRRGRLDVLALGDFIVENCEPVAAPDIPQSGMGPEISFTPWESRKRDRGADDYDH